RYAVCFVATFVSVFIVGIVNIKVFFTKISLQVLFDGFLPIKLLS
ncbi:hypothetical protein X975_11470, partial [Stegodyphus mimosarum]